MKAIRKSLFMPVDLIKKIELYQKENYISSFTASVIQILVKGFELIETEGVESNEAIQSNRNRKVR